MRYLLDTNIVLYWAVDFELLSADVYDALNETDALLYVSAETVRELVIGYNNKSFDTRRRKSAEELVRSIEDEFLLKILPISKEHMLTYSRLRPDLQHGHKDPSDHIIIAHTITENLTLVSSDRHFPYS